MNFYIDFDSTLYNTSGLVEKMLRALAAEMSNQDSSLDAEEMYLEEKGMFNSKNIYNIFELCRYFAKKYNLDADSLILAVNGVISNGKDLVYEDSAEFLKQLKAMGHRINMLTYTAQDGLEYQMQKIYGSGLIQLFDNIIITSTPKWQLDLNYSQGVFVDDNPKDLAGLHGNNPIAVIRIKREGNKYASKPMPDDIQIPEVESLLEVCQKFNLEASIVVQEQN